MTNEPPLIALVGRPNVGKSTLFNRLIGRRRALVEDKPGITRDRQYGVCEWNGRTLRVMDTGGMVEKAASSIQAKTTAQALMGVDEADAVVMLVDGRAGPTKEDREWIAQLRKLSKPLVLAINKIDNPKLEDLKNDFYEWGFEPMVTISSEIGLGVGEMLDLIYELVPAPPMAESEVDPPFSVAIIGRPNVGKSTLLNALLGKERTVVDDTPGTTRDPIDSLVTHEGEVYRVIDTAGIRKRGRISERIETLSVIKGLQSLDRTDLVLFMIDGVEGPTEQDAHVAGEAHKRGRAVVILINKWDVATTDPENRRKAMDDKLDRAFAFIGYAPRLYLSAKTGKNVAKIWPTVVRIRAQFEKRVTTSALNKTFEKLIASHPLPTFAGKDIKLYYATQTGVKPPSFTVFANQPTKIHFSYERYLINGLRETFEMGEVPVRIIFRKKT